MIRQFRSLSQAIDRFRSLEDAIPARVIHTYIAVAGWDTGDDGPTMGELATVLGLNANVVTRHVAALSKKHRLGKPGLDLVDTRPGTDPRSKRVVLTQKGKTLREQLINIMERD